MIIFPSPSTVVFSVLLRYRDPKDRIFNGVISDISLKLRETIRTISYSIETGSPMETEIVRVVPLSSTAITDLPGRIP